MTVRIIYDIYQSEATFPTPPCSKHESMQVTSRQIYVHTMYKDGRWMLVKPKGSEDSTRKYNDTLPGRLPAPVSHINLAPWAPVCRLWSIVSFLFREGWEGLAINISTAGCTETSGKASEW